MDWCLIVHKIQLEAAQLFCKYFHPGLSLCILYFLFDKGKDTSAIPQPSVRILVYVFPIFFRSHVLMTSTEAKISLHISFFTEACISSYFYFHDALELLVAL